MYLSHPRFVEEGDTSDTSIRYLISFSISESNLLPHLFSRVSRPESSRVTLAFTWNCCPRRVCHFRFGARVSVEPLSTTLCHPSLSPLSSLDDFTLAAASSSTLVRFSIKVSLQVVVSSNGYCTQVLKSHPTSLR